MSISLLGSAFDMVTIILKNRRYLQYFMIGINVYYGDSIIGNIFHVSFISKYCIERLISNSYIISLLCIIRGINHRDSIILSICYVNFIVERINCYIARAIPYNYIMPLRIIRGINHRDSVIATICYVNFLFMLLRD